MGEDDELGTFFDNLPRWGSLPVPPDLNSTKIKAVLSLGLTQPSALTSSDIQELSASVVHHLVTSRCTKLPK